MPETNDQTETFERKKKLFTCIERETTQSCAQPCIKNTHKKDMEGSKSNVLSSFLLWIVFFCILRQAWLQQISDYKQCPAHNLATTVGQPAIKCFSALSVMLSKTRVVVGTTQPLGNVQLLDLNSFCRGVTSGGNLNESVLMLFSSKS